MFLIGGKQSRRLNCTPFLICSTYSTLEVDFCTSFSEMKCISVTNRFRGTGKWLATFYISPKVNFINVLQAAFVYADPRRKIQSVSLFCAFRICAPRVNFMNVLQAAFARSRKRRNTAKSSVSFNAFGICTHKNCS